MPWEKSSADLVRFFEQVVPILPNVEHRKMFGCHCAFVNGNLFAGLFQQGMTFRLSPSDQAAFLDQPDTGLFEPMKGHKMKGYVILNDPFAVGDDTVANWIRCSLEFAAKLPPKERATKKSAKRAVKKRAALSPPKSPKNRPKKDVNIRNWCLLPARLTMAVLFAAPLLIVCGYSVLSRGDYGGVEKPWTLESYTRLMDPLYGVILWRSFALAALTTIICAVLGFPLALFISRSGRAKNLCLQLVILPFWTSFLVRTYAWLFLLRETGLVNTVLMKLGLIHTPLPLLYNWGAVLLGLVYAYLPFMVLPLYATLERIDPSLLEAAADLGMRPLRAVFRIVLPLTTPGLIAGGILVFIPCLGAYLTPDLLGGGKTVMAGNLIQNQFSTARDWPFGSAVSLIIMLSTALLLIGLLRRSSEEVL